MVRSPNRPPEQESVAVSPDFNDPLPEDAPEGSLVDQMEDEADLERLREETGVHAEAQYERDADERRTMDILETMRNLQHGDEIEWRITRLGHEDPDMNGFLETWPNSLMTLERIRDKLGGGKYHLQGMRRGRYHKHFTIQIAGDAVRRNKKAREVEGQTQFNVTEFLAQQESRDAQRRRADEEQRERRREEEERREERRRKNFLEMVTAIGAVAAPIVAQIVGKKDDTAALIAALKPKETSPLEILQLLREMRQLDAPAQPAANPVEQAITLLERFKDMGALGGGGNETSWFDIAREAVKAMGPTVGQGIQSIMEQAAAAKAIEAARAAQAPPQPLLPAQGTGAAPGSPQARLPAPANPVSTQPPTAAGHSPAGLPRSAMGISAGTAASPSTSGQTIAGDDEMLKLLPLLSWLKGETERLLIAAARGSDPELRAAAMFDDMPDNADIEAVGQVLSRADWFMLFTQLDSRVAQYEPWFAEVRSTLLQLIAEETGVSFGARSDGGVTETGRQVVNVQGLGAVRSEGVFDPTSSGSSAPAPARVPVRAAQPSRRDPNAPIERPAAPPSLTGE